MKSEETVERLGDWMQTYTGRMFWPCDPRPEEIVIEDIAHALANQCRYAGHCKKFYSVAQHSVIVSIACDRTDALWGLLHDAAEAYLVDLPRPVKRHSELGAHYRDMEAKLVVAICKKFGLPVAEPLSVKVADDRVLVTEMRDLMAEPPRRWKETWTAIPYDFFIRPLPPAEAERVFLKRFRQLTEGGPGLAITAAAAETTPDHPMSYTGNTEGRQ